MKEKEWYVECKMSATCTSLCPYQGNHVEFSHIQSILSNAPECFVYGIALLLPSSPCIVAEEASQSMPTLVGQ